MFAFALLGLWLAVAARAQITVYGQKPLAQAASTTTNPAAPAVTTYAAYNDTTLIPPPVPSPAITTNFTLSLTRDAATTAGLSIPHVGAAFFGFSMEMSVINQVLGKNSSFVQVPFLNLMANLQERAGGVVVRIGGNTQERAMMVDDIPGGSVITKQKISSTQTTQTPAVLYSIDMFYLCSNISSLVNVKWFLGLPFNDTSNWRFQIAEYGQGILGDNLLGLQAGNEPDLYTNNGHRTDPNYGPTDFFNEWGMLIQALDADSKILNKNMLIGPSVEGAWSPEMVWATGFIDTYKARMYALAVEHYPTNNCAAQFNTGAPIKIPQEEFAGYLRHDAGSGLIQPYLASTALAVNAGLPFIMFETNTASCGGFAGISDTYGAALWGLDYGLQMAYSNFSNALIHIGGQNAFYNPFTAPPTNQTEFNEWTVGAIYYSTLVIAEILGKTNTSRVLDLNANSGNVFTPAYAIYEHDTLSKIALFNYIDDDSGASNIVASITVPNAGVPATVKVKYLSASSVSVKNMTWAGQSFGSRFEVDGRLKGDLNVVTINCDTTANVCLIPLQAPDFALVFLGDDEALTVGQTPLTFATTAYTKTRNTLKIDPTSLAVSNGHSGNDRQKMGSTSHGSKNAATGLQGLLERACMALWMVAGGAVVLMGIIDL